MLIPIIGQPGPRHFANSRAANRSGLRFKLASAPHPLSSLLPSSSMHRPSQALTLLDIPPEVLLFICSYLDLPDLAALAQAVPSLGSITSDPILHLQRLRIVCPSRINHSLFGTSPEGHGFRPSVGDLVHRGVMRGLNLERRWRMGVYFYSRDSIIQYERGRALTKRHLSHLVSVQLTKRVPSPASAYKSLHAALILPDVESSSTNVSRTLLPIVRQLKWCLRRDQLARNFKTGPYANPNDRMAFWTWLESKGRSIVQDGERLRLAVCPDLKRKIRFYETLSAVVAKGH
ncbi:hypothetical protein D9756_005930 [Leucocoprinus leucothites]|uniref:F-box domain-containing protein n=1 Tax=Leucocoprinus leucothites TaxID=201217 RepID=A0A8H5D4T1_9AGAR|nr:hypothetical protein D9756_005930 [Leucoagaricus leucothites]